MKHHLLIILLLGIFTCTHEKSTSSYLSNPGMEESPTNETSMTGRIFEDTDGCF